MTHFIEKVLDSKVLTILFIFWDNTESKSYKTK